MAGAPVSLVSLPEHNEFQNLNRIQQEALAKSMNMSTDELAKTLTQQAQLGKLGEAQRARVKELRAAGKDELADRERVRSLNLRNAIIMID